MSSVTSTSWTIRLATSSTQAARCRQSPWGCLRASLTECPKSHRAEVTSSWATCSVATQAWTGSLLGRSHWAQSRTRTLCTIQVQCRCLGTRGVRGPLTTQVRGLQCSVTAMPSPRGAEAVLPEFLPHRTTMEGSALPRSNPIEGLVLEEILVTAFIVSCIARLPDPVKVDLYN